MQKALRYYVGMSSDRAWAAGACLTGLIGGRARPGSRFRLLAPLVGYRDLLEVVLVHAQTVQHLAELGEVRYVGDRGAFGVPHAELHAGLVHDLVDQPPTIR
jgi:hypothetical protein